MFSAPLLEAGRNFPPSPTDDPAFMKLLGELGMQINPVEGCALRQATEYAIGYIEEDLSVPHPVRSRPYPEIPLSKKLRHIGLIDAIPPPDPDQDITVTDGGIRTTYRYRLDGIDTLRKSGELITPQLVVYAGQRLRMPADDNGGLLEQRAIKVLDDVGPWAREWLLGQLQKDPHAAGLWQRPFATEHEIAILAVLEQYGTRLEHHRQIRRTQVAQIHESIPPATIAAEDFALDNGDLMIRILNAEAILREHVGRVHPISEARPTGRSCFFECVRQIEPAEDSKVLVITHNPNIYRTWLDHILGAREIGRQDLRIQGAGPMAEPHRSFGYILRGLADIIMNFYNYQYEGGVNAPGTAAVPLQPRLTA